MPRFDPDRAVRHPPDPLHLPSTPADTDDDTMRQVVSREPIEERIARARVGTIQPPSSHKQLDVDFSKLYDQH